MLHLTADRLAALADEQPNQIEAAHLAACPVCARERDAYLQLTTLAEEAGRRPPALLTSWEGIEAALQGGEAAAPRARWTPRLGSRGGWRLPSRRLVAAAALLTVGAVGGRVTAGVPLLGGTQPAPEVVAVDSLGGDDADAAGAGFHTAGDALAAMAQAERQYQLAANFLAGHDSSEEPVVDSSAVYRARLAALDEVMAATRAALYTAPFDPVINRYYLATVGARELTVRQLGTVLPTGQTVTRF